MTEAAAPITDNTEDILDLVAKEGMLDRASINADSKLADLDIPSLEMISILFAIEDKFGVEVEIDEIQQAKTMRDLIDVVLARIRPAAPP
jgi:acyl carrier protein